MLAWFDKLARICVVILVGILIWRVWVWLSPDAPRKYLRTDLVNAQEGDTFFTGFASLGVVRFRYAGELHTLEFMKTANKLDNAKGYCYRLYEISVGYPSLRAAVASAEAASTGALKVPDPQVLSANVIESRSGGDDVATSDCDTQDYVTPQRPNVARLAALQQEFVENGQWDAQRLHGQRVLTSFSAKLTALRQEAAQKKVAELSARGSELAVVSDAASLRQWSQATSARLDDGAQLKKDLTKSLQADPAALAGPGQFEGHKRDLRASLDRELDTQREDFARAGGYLGALKLTFATIGIFNQTEGRWFWKNDHFYIRQDLAEATYGTDFARHVALMRGGLFAPRRLVLSVPEPRLLALDRYSTLQVTKENKPFSLKGDKDGTQIEQAMSDDLDKFMRRVTPQAIRFAKSALTAQMLELAGDEVGEIEVRFVADDSETPSQIAELVRQLQEQRRQPPKDN
jgi:hypothetical protein